ncbi:hypothetical protein [Lentilactobacillus hilgardii]|nr:hypothetical protein [Lentilactobacillus hilgardii]
MVLNLPTWVGWLLFSGFTFFLGSEYRKYKVMKARGKQADFWREWFD